MGVRTKDIQSGRKGRVALLKIVIPHQTRPELDSMLNVAKVEDDLAGLLRKS